MPTVRIDDLSEVDIHLLRLDRNRIAEESSWDTVELSDEWRELQPIAMDLGYEVLGFTTPEIDSLLYLSRGKEQEDADDYQIEVGEPASEVSRLGDLWVLGDHLVLCGSSLETDNLKRLMGGDKARMVLTDQPYNLRIQGHVGDLGKHKHREFVQASGEMDEAQFTQFLTTSIAALAESCGDGALLYVFMDWRNQGEILSGSRPMLVVVLNDWVIETKLVPAFSSASTSLAKPSSERLGHVVQSYVDEATINFNADRKLLPDPECYAKCFEDSFNELGDAANRFADHSAAVPS